MNEPLPCPFCNAEANSLDAEEAAPAKFYVRCSNTECETFGPTAETWSEAVRFWNQRTPEEKKRVLAIAEKRKEFYVASDGFTYWCPSIRNFGGLSAQQLRWVAAELDRKNAGISRNNHDYFHEEETK